MAGVTKGTLLPKQEVNIKEGVYLAKCLSIDLQTCRKFCMDFLIYNYVTINLALLTLKFKVQQAISSKKIAICHSQLRKAPFESSTLTCLFPEIPHMRLKFIGVERHLTHCIKLCSCDSTN